MLNIERVDRKERGMVEIEFTTETADSALTIILSEDEAWKLAQMIIDRCTMLAKNKFFK